MARSRCPGSTLDLAGFAGGVLIVYRPVGRVRGHEAALEILVIGAVVTLVINQKLDVGGNGVERY